MYLQGRSVAKDAARGIELIRTAANQGDADAQFYLGTLYGRGEFVARDFTQATDWLQRAAAQQHFEAKNELAWLIAIRSESTNAELQRALQLAREAREADPDSPAIADTLGWLLVLTGSPLEAVAHLSYAIENSSPVDPAGSRYRLAVAYRDLGETDKAVAALRSSLDGSERFSERADAEALLEDLLSAPFSTP